MTTLEIANLTRIANEIGKAGNLTCKYGYTARRTRFEWQFYRHGHLVGWTHVAAKVISKAEKLVGSKGGQV